MNVKPKFTASMMCAPFGNLAHEVAMLEKAGVDSFHIDVMDGEFVDNFGLGYQDMKFISQATSKEIDVHLMVSKPMNYLNMLQDIGATAVYIHPESSSDPATTLEKLLERNILPGIAINPGTSIPYVEELLHTCRRVLVLGVNPGHAGRVYQNYVDQKLFKLLKLKESLDYEIWLDGAVTVDRVKKWSKLGVNGFVLGTSCLFKKDISYIEAMRSVQLSLL